MLVKTVVRLVLSLVWLPGLLVAQSASQLKQAYVEKYKLMAIENMHRTGVPASITLAQGLLESGVGQSPLAVEANNHFGIKCHKEWTGPTYIMDDDEKNECFRKYNSVLDSYLDHAEFLRSRPRYEELFKLNITDYKGWAHGLKAAGYATNPNYAPLLIKQIEELGLADYDGINGTQLAALQQKKQEQPQSVETTTREALDQPLVPCQAGVFKFNKVKVVCAEAGDSPLAIAEKHGLYPWQVLKFNDLDEERRFKSGELVYLEGKRSRAENMSEHTVGEYESLHDISQRYGVSLKALRRKNQLRGAEELAAGETAFLINKRADRPKVRTLADIETLRSERDRREAALKKPAAPATVTSKPKPALATPIEKAKPIAAEPIANIENPDLKLSEIEVLKPVEIPQSAVTRTTLNPTEKVAADVQPAKPPAGVKTEPTQPKTAKKHVVAKGDTLFNISRRYGLTVAELRELNKLEGTDIQLGMELIVSK
jgi:LysM repeat protein